MSIAKVVELKSASKISFDDTIKSGLQRAVKTLDNISGAWISDQVVLVDKDKILECRVLMKVTFVLMDKTKA